MLSKILSWLTSGTSAWVYAVCLAAGFFLGGYAAHTYYTNEILRLSKESYEAQAKLEQARNDALYRLAQTQLEASTWRDASDKRISDLTHRVQLAESSRVQREQASERAIAASEKRCRALLVRGAEVVRGCSAVLGNAVVRCDALIEFNK